MSRKIRKTDPTPDQPGIAEVRRWRAKVVKASGGTVRGLVESLRESQRAREANPIAKSGKPRSRRPAA